jgi:MFS transporter, PAT family, beta-lactamase induction signal transducer AmpG
MLEVFKSRKMASLLVLGFSSGLPLYLTGRALQAWMTVEGVNLTAIGFISLTSLPYSIKFLWAPLIDRFSLPFLGRRKGWIVFTQLLLALAIAAMALQRPAEALQVVAINAVMIAFLSATQDIVIDAYGTDILDRYEVGAGAGIKVLGYRAGMIMAGGVALMLADRLTWPTVYALLGVLMLLVLAVSTRVPEPVLRDEPPSSMKDAVRMPIADFFSRLGLSRGLFVLAFVVLYRLGDSLIDNMTTPFLLQTGFTQTDVGAIQGGIGLFTTIIGVLAGGAVLSRIGINRSLWIFGVLQVASNFAYLLLANIGKNYPMMVATVVVENFCYGLATAVIVGFIMSLCNPKFSATQYALLSGVLAVGRNFIAAPAGSIVQYTGWPAFFLISVAVALPGMALLPFFAPWRKGVEPFDPKPF